MSHLPLFIREWLFAIIVGLSLLAGLIGAYGRERHDGKSPDIDWWRTRFYIMPFLAIVVTFCVSQFSLTREQGAMLSALLSMGGYEVVRVIVSRFETKVDEALGEAKPRTFASIVDTDDNGRPVAHIMVDTDPAHPRRSGIGEGLRSVYQPTKAGELDRDQSLIDELDRRTQGDDSDSREDPALQP